MKHSIENEVLTIFLEGELNSYNSEDVEKEIDSILGKGGFKSIKIDMDDLTYISSAGLRIVVRIKQQYDDTVLVKVPDGVYDIFEMVGFQNLLKIERK